MKKIISIAIITAMVWGCGTSARIEKTWRDPDVTVNLSKLNKVLVVALLRNETVRRNTEDKLAAMLKGKGIASYNYLTKDVTKENEEAIKAKLKSEGFDGAVVMRLADVDKDIRYVPGTYNTYPGYYGRFWPYYWNAYPYYFQPGYYESTKTFTVETNVYSFNSDKLVWSGITTSVDPQNVDKLMDATAKVVYKKMKEEKFIVD
ncbi:MAG: hypothetical protein QM731_00470 [Chitinophagaceae bacterium]